MKTIEDRAHEILLKMLEGINPMQLEKPTRDGLAYEAYELAKAMQAEAEKRKTKGDAEPMRKVREAEWQPDWSQAPEYCVMTDYHDGCYVYFNGELCIAHGVNNTPVAVPKDLRKRP